MSEENKKTIYLDESGELGFSNKSSRYFVIFLYATQKDEKFLKKIIKNVKDRNIKSKKVRSLEIKGSSSSINVKKKLINEILKKDESLKLFCIIVEKERIIQNLRENKRILYNWLCTEIMKYNDFKINLITDRKEKKESLINDMNSYLYYKNKNIESIEQRNSSHYAGLQISDVFANSVFREFESNQSELFQLFKSRTIIKTYFFRK